MHTENLLNHQDDGCPRLSFRCGAIGGNAAISHRYLDLAFQQTFCIGFNDSLRGYRSRSQGKASSQRRHDKVTSTHHRRWQVGGIGIRKMAHGGPPKGYRRAFTPGTPACGYESDLCSGLPFRLVEAISANSFSSMDLYMELDAPFSSLTFSSPRLADKAAPAAFCCAWDFAGMMNLLTCVFATRITVSLLLCLTHISTRQKADM